MTFVTGQSTVNTDKSLVAASNIFVLALLQLVRQVRDTIAGGIRHIEGNMVAVCVCAAIMFPAYWFVWTFLFPQPYENLSLRLVGSLCCLIVAAKDRWPNRARAYLPVVWLGTVLYCGPFFFTFMLLQNDTSTVWLLSTMAGLFLVVLLVDWISLFVLFIGGAIMAWRVHLLLTPETMAVGAYFQFVPIFLFALVTGAIFNYRAAGLRQAKERARLELGLFFANEMQAPLFSVRTNTASLKKFLPSLVHAYSASRRPPSMPESMRQHLQALELVPTRIEAAVEQMRGAIEILMSEGGQVSAAPDGTSSMLRCLDEAIARVPLAAEFDRARITVVRPSASEVAAGSVVVDTVIAIPLTADSIDLSVSVPLLAASEDLLLYLRLINAAGDTVFRTNPYPQPVTVTSSSRATPVATTIAYVGVGFDAVSVTITTPDTAVFFGQTLQLTAVAWGPLEQTIPGTPVAWRSLDSTRVRVPDRAVGQVVGGTARGTARIVAQLLNGPADTVLVAAQPTAATLIRISGDSQTAVPGVALPLPLRVRVTAADLLGVRVPVTFRALNAGDSVASALVLSDSTGYAETIALIGPAAGPRSFQASVNGIAAPVSFTATALSGAVASVTLDRAVDTIPRGATLQYTATARDSLGNPVSVTIGWSSTAPSVATVDGAGLATAIGGDSARIIAAAAGHADTARLYVRVLRSVVAAPVDTVMTAIGDSFDLRATAYDNFGGVVPTGFTRRFVSATPTVVTVNATTGRTRSVGAGNGVVVVRDSVDASLKVQATATVRVNQITATIQTVPTAPDSLKVGVNGKGQIVARARDRNGFQIPGKAFAFVSRDPAVASVNVSGLVTGLQLGGTTYVIDSLSDGAATFKDSVFVAVVSSPPALLQWGFDSLAVGNGGSVSVPLTLSRIDSGVTTVLLSVIPAGDTLIARPAAGCPGGTLKQVQIPANTAATSVLICGLAAGRVTLVAQDSAGVFLPDTMVVTVVSTIEFREIGQFGRQTYFYVNQRDPPGAGVSVGPGSRGRARRDVRLRAGGDVGGPALSRHHPGGPAFGPRHDPGLRAWDRFGRTDVGRLRRQVLLCVRRAR